MSKNERALLIALGEFVAVFGQAAALDKAAREGTITMEEEDTIDRASEAKMIKASEDIEAALLALAEEDAG